MSVLKAYFDVFSLVDQDLENKIDIYRVNHKGKFKGNKEVKVMFEIKRNYYVHSLPSEKKEMNKFLGNELRVKECYFID